MKLLIIQIWSITPVGPSPTTFSFHTEHTASMDSQKQLQGYNYCEHVCNEMLNYDYQGSKMFIFC